MRKESKDINTEGMDFDPEVITWMKTHDVREIKALAAEIENRGGDAVEVKEFYQELKSIDKDWKKHSSNGHYQTEEGPFTR